ncbi:serine/threonine-protein kinase [Pseudomonas thivervalensis]|jgi:eukaryotic-like serine/threonine-protein kinase|uniref:serine/threonine-protein kinase n=1 Tax=Pseudomonas thivervalensis TaxID=86265 RepID=UPI003D6A44A8
MYGVYSRAEVEFEYKKEIGQDGKNSRAYLAHDKYLDAELVIKEMAQSSFENSDAFFAESRLLYKAAHAHVVQIQYACACENNIYLALPFYRNGSLKDFSKNNNLTVREIVRFSIQICSGLHNIHSKGLIHFDVKPDNILLSDRLEALVSDFGLAKAMGLNYMAAPAQMYTKHMAPEYFTETEFTSQYDIYQLGLTIYRLIVGETEFNTQIATFGSFDELKDAILTEAFPRRLSLEHIPSRLKSIVENCLKVDRNERYNSALEVANELAQIDDKTLDWVYENDDGIRRWHKVTPTHEYLLEIDRAGTSVAQKKTTAGKWSKIKESCGGLTTAAIKRFLRKF